MRSVILAAALAMMASGFSGCCCVSQSTCGTMGFNAGCGCDSGTCGSGGDCCRTGRCRGVARRPLTRVSGGWCSLGSRIGLNSFGCDSPGDCGGCGADCGGGCADGLFGGAGRRLANRGCGGGLFGCGHCADCGGGLFGDCGDCGNCADCGNGLLGDRGGRLARGGACGCGGAGCGGCGAGNGIFGLGGGFGSAMGGLAGNGYGRAGGFGADGAYAIADGGFGADHGHGIALAGGQVGCGMHGCGIGGRLCGHCRARLGGARPIGAFGPPNNPYGAIPHTPALDPYGMYGGGGAGFGGGPVPTYQYPYYTTRGPRDFLLDACGPAPVGPYNPCKPCLPTIGW